LREKVVKLIIDDLPHIS